MAALRHARAATVRVPGDKSISHRALIFAALSDGASRISNILDSADVQSTARVLRALGARIPPLSADCKVDGLPPRSLRPPAGALDCGNSGTTARLAAGVVAGTGLSATFTGDASLCRRPMRRVAEPLRAMGAAVRLSESGTLPMAVRGGPMRSIEWESEIASAQVKSAILLAALFGGVRAVVREPHLSRDHTERMLLARGVALRRDRHGTVVELDAAQAIRPEDARVPSDPSTAAFLGALAILRDDLRLRLPDVCLNPTRVGFFQVLRRMGADVAFDDQREDGGELVGTIVAANSELAGVSVTAEEVPAMIDELPLFACVAARASGDSIVRGAAELRVKESDRIATIVGNLRLLGADAEELPDGFRVTGSRRPLRGRVATHGDHRIAMAFGILGAVPGNAIEVDDRACVAVSYPGFWRELERVVA